jgi:hypothetical protein
MELTADQRKMLPKASRSGTDSRSTRGVHVVLLRAAGWTWDRIREALFCSNDLMADAPRTWDAGGVITLVEQPSAAAPVPAWLWKVPTGFPSARRRTSVASAPAGRARACR